MNLRRTVHRQTGNPTRRILFVPGNHTDTIGYQARFCRTKKPKICISLHHSRLHAVCPNDVYLWARRPQSRRSRRSAAGRSARLVLASSIARRGISRFASSWPRSWPHRTHSRSRSRAGLRGGLPHGSDYGTPVAHPSISLTSEVWIGIIAGLSS